MTKRTPLSHDPKCLSEWAVDVSAWGNETEGDAEIIKISEEGARDTEELTTGNYSYLEENRNEGRKRGLNVTAVIMIFHLIIITVI